MSFGIILAGIRRHPKCAKSTSRYRHIQVRIMLKIGDFPSFSVKLLFFFVRNLFKHEFTAGDLQRAVYGKFKPVCVCVCVLLRQMNLAYHHIEEQINEKIHQSILHVSHLGKLWQLLLPYFFVFDKLLSTLALRYYNQSCLCVV